MHIHVSALKQRGPVWKFEGKAMVDGKLAAEAIFSAMILDKK
jgi:3-hydroxyacyl-[acyl-carrier-protein] dehydratase